MKIFGHRGAAGLVTENTLESIEEALKYEVDGIEIDIHRCKSGELVVIHDTTLQRTTNGMGNVSEYTLKELSRYRTMEGYKIPTLEQVMDVIDGKCVLNIELKGIGTAIPTIELLEKRIALSNWDTDNLVLSSFDHAQLFQIKSMTSVFKLGVLTETTVSDVLPVAHALQAFSVHPPIYFLTEKEVSLAKNIGYEVYTWTVNDASMIKTAKAWKVDAVITDFPNFA